MDVSSVIKCVCGLTIGIFLVTNVLDMNVFAKSEVSISPLCGPKSGLNLSIKANGFAIDDIASWELKDSDGKTRLNGYFHTDSDGNVNDQTAIEDVEKGHYKIYFGCYTNYDGRLDSEIDHSEITIPCENN
jgi:hypothetical protein